MRRSNLLQVTLFAVVSFCFASLPVYTYAQSDKFITLVPQLPLLGNQTSVPELLNALFGITVAVAAILAVIMFVVGGFQYMASEALNSKSDARNRMQQAILGLLIVLTAVLVLNTINPDITMLNIFRNVPADSRPPDAAVNTNTPFNAYTACTPPDTTATCCAAIAGSYTVVSSDWTDASQTRAKCVLSR